MSGTKITLSRRKRLQVPNDPIVPFIEGDGIGPDIWAAAVRVIDAAVEKAYAGEKKIHWKEIYAGEKANAKFDEWLPEATTETIKDHLVAIKGPLTTPVGGGFRSLNVAIRQILDRLKSRAWWIWSSSARIPKTFMPVSNTCTALSKMRRLKTF